MFNATCKDYKILNMEVCFLSEGTTLDTVDLDNTCERNMIMNNYDEFVDATINHNYNNVIIVMGKDARYIKRGFYLCGDGRIFKIDDSGDSHVFSIYESKLIFNSINDFNNNDYLGDIIERTNVKLIGEMCEECAGLIAKAYKFTGIIAKAYKFKGDETSNIFAVSNYDDIIEHSKGYDIIKIFDASGVDIAELWYFQHLDNKPLVLMRWNRA